MISLRVACLSAVLVASVAFAQTHDHKAAESATVSVALQSFTDLKALAGTWQGHVTMNPPFKDASSADVRITMRVTSRGNALVHEIAEAGAPDDPTKYDHPVTMFYVDSDRLYLTHYCDAGNRPRMVARSSNPSSTVEFDFVDLTGGTKYGHMDHAVFTFVDPDHHIEEWTYMMPGDKPMHARMELQRVKER